MNLTQCSENLLSRSRQYRNISRQCPFTVYFSWKFSWKNSIDFFSPLYGYLARLINVALSIDKRYNKQQMVQIPHQTRLSRSDEKNVLFCSHCKTLLPGWVITWLLFTITLCHNKWYLLYFDLSFKILLIYNVFPGS